MAKQRLRILALTDTFPPYHVGGHEVSACRILSMLQLHGHEINVLTIKNSEPRVYSYEFAIEEIFVDRYPTTLTNRLPSKLHGFLDPLIRFGNAKLNRQLLADHLRDHAYDVAIMWGVQRIGSAVANELTARGIPVIWSIADYFHQERRRFHPKSMLSKVSGWILKRQISDDLRSDWKHAVFNSNFLLDQYRKSSDLAQCNWYVHRSQDIDFNADPLPISNRLPVFLTICQLQRHKGIHIVINALAKIKSEPHAKGAVLNVIGDGDTHYLNELKSLASELGVESMIQFVGKIDHESVIEQVRHARCVISPSLWDEPFGRVTLEAIACGTPLINSDSGAVREIVDESRALIYPREDADALAACMLDVLVNPESAEYRAKLGLDFAKEHFSAEAEAVKFEEILRSIVDGDPERSNPTH